jgi:hypothetical protein
VICSLLAYDAAGNVIGTLDFMVHRNDDGEADGLIDFAAHEAAGGKLTDVWKVGNATGSGTWPEWLGSRAHDFTVELGPGKRITALVHRDSGHRRERVVLEAAIAFRIAEAAGEPADIRDLVGGPTAPLVLDDAGRTIGRSPQPAGSPAHLPVIGMVARQQPQ